MIDVCIAGVTGWTGHALAEAVAAAPDMRLAAAVARRSAGRPLSEVVEGADAGVTVSASVEEALGKAKVDVLVDYTAPDAVREHVLTAIRAGVAVVVGTSGLTAEDYAEIDELARGRKVGVLAAGNFSLTAALLFHAALLAAEHVDSFEVIDYASATKPDVPSGTSRELAERLGAVKRPVQGRRDDEIHGPIEARGADVDGVRVHSVRLPSYTLSAEVVFAMEHERLTIRHDSDSNAGPYVEGTLLGIRRVRDHAGLVRGLDTLLFG
jgi:4-hydroxy-tetrahydrodipicolinate reductase